MITLWTPINRAGRAKASDRQVSRTLGIGQEGVGKLTLAEKLSRFTFPRLTAGPRPLRARGVRSTGGNKRGYR